jgi:hypothetical protein
MEEIVLSTFDQDFSIVTATDRSIPPTGVKRTIFTFVDTYFKFSVGETLRVATFAKSFYTWTQSIHYPKFLCERLLKALLGDNRQPLLKKP